MRTIFTVVKSEVTSLDILNPPKGIWNACMHCSEELASGKCAITISVAMHEGLYLLGSSRIHLCSRLGDDRVIPSVFPSQEEAGSALLKIRDLLEVKNQRIIVVQCFTGFFEPEGWYTHKDH